MTSLQEQRISRGLILKGDEIHFKNLSFEKKIILLKSKIATERTIAARLLKKYKTTTTVTFLINALKLETKLYSKIEICNSLAELGALAIIPFIAHFTVEIINDLSELPHFKTVLSSYNTPQKIISLRNKIETCDGIIICTPEYVFSIPSRLKNLIEWCVSTTVFSNKPSGLITAAANGTKAHTELMLIMKTIQANFTPDTTLLIQGVKGKILNNQPDNNTNKSLENFISSFYKLVGKTVKE